MPRGVCSLSSPACPLVMRTVVPILGVWTVGSCVPGHSIWLGKEERQRHRGNGHEVGFGLWHCRVLGDFILWSSKHLCMPAGR